MNEDKTNGKNKFIASNIDTTIEEIEISKSNDGKLYRKTDSLEHDGNEGVVNRVKTTLTLDACGSIITKREEIAGVCHSCGRPIKFGNDVRCEGRGGELMCLVCYQRQGSHELHGKKYCRHDYWNTKLFWQFISPAIRNRSMKNGDRKDITERYRESGSPAFRNGRQVRTTLQKS
jgi:hypothetical protein